MSHQASLDRLGIALPAVPTPVAAYVPWVRCQNIVFISGQLPLTEHGLLAKGVLGADVDLETGQRAARQAALRALAALAEGASGIDNILRVLRVGVYVASAPGFEQQHLVANGASELIIEVLGEASRHARFAIGVAALPLGAPVEVELVAEIAWIDDEEETIGEGSA